MSNKTTSKIWAFAIGYGSLAVYLSTIYKSDFITALFIAAPFALFIYFLFGLWFIAPIVEKILDSMDRSNYQKQSHNNQIMSRQNEEAEYHRNQERRYNERVRELELEFEHIKRLLTLQANIDEGKLNTLKSMQAELKNNKQADLNALKAQIDAMKRG